MLASLVSWSFSLIFSALLAREIAHRVRGADYRAHRRGGVSRRRQRVGARPVVVGGVDHGDAGFVAGFDREHHAASFRSVRRSGLWQSLLIAGRAHRRVDGRLVLLGAERGAREVDGGHGRHVRAGDERRRPPRDARRVARVQPAADDRDLRARLRLSRARGHRQRAERAARSSTTTFFCS